MCDISFSVIIPLYQKGDSVAGAIESVLTQSFTSFEIIIVDDGSTDNGPEIVGQYNDDRIKLVRQHNQGVSVARNRGIKTAKNKYLAFLDADDKWEPDFLSEMKRLIEIYPGCGWYSCGWNRLLKDKTIVPNKCILEEGIIHNYFELASTNEIINSSSVVIPAFLFSEIGGFPEGVSKGEDLIMWMKIASVLPVCYTNKRLSWYVFDEKASKMRRRTSEPDYYKDYLEVGNYQKNEYIAGIAIHKGILESIYGDKNVAKSILNRYSFTSLHQDSLGKLRTNIRIPCPILRLYLKILQSLISIKNRITKK